MEGQRSNGCTFVANIEYPVLLSALTGKDTLLAAKRYCWRTACKNDGTGRPDGQGTPPEWRVVRNVLGFEAFRRVARPRAQLARDRDLEDLHLVGGTGLVVAQVARDEERIALLDLERAAVLELQLDPALDD